MLQGFSAGFLGAIIGLIVAISVNPMFWWIGLVVGFTIGRLTYDWQEAKETIKSWFSGWNSQGALKILRDIPLWLSKVLGNCLYFVILLPTLWVMPILMVYIITMYTHEPFWTSTTLDNLVLLVGLFPAGIFFCLIGTRMFLEQEVIDVQKLIELAEDPDNLPNNYAQVSWSKKIIVCIRIMFLIPVSLVGYVFAIFLLIRSIIKLIGRILTTIFSDEKNAVGFGAAIGVLIGYSMHFTSPLIMSVIIGGLVGGFVATIFYRLFHVYILKLKNNW